MFICQDSFAVIACAKFGGIRVTMREVTDWDKNLYVERIW